MGERLEGKEKITELFERGKGGLCTFAYNMHSHLLTYLLTYLLSFSQALSLSFSLSPIPVPLPLSHTYLSPYYLIRMVIVQALIYLLKNSAEVLLHNM